MSFPGVSTNVPVASYTTAGVLQVDPSLVVVGGIISSKPATYAVAGVVQVDPSLNITGSVISSRTARYDTWLLSNVYRSGESVLYTDGRYYVANSSMPASTAFVVGTGANTWTLIGPVLVTGGATSVKTAATYTILLSDFMLRGNATAANQVFTLPTSASAFVNGIGQMYRLKKIDSSSNSVTLQANGSELIDGVTIRAAITTQYSAIAVISNGIGWDII